MNPVDMDDNDSAMDFETERLTNEGDVHDDDDDDDGHPKDTDDEDQEYYQDRDDVRGERDVKRGHGILAPVQEQNISHLRPSVGSYDISQYPPKMDAIPDHSIMIDNLDKYVTPESCKLIDDSMFDHDDFKRDGQERMSDNFRWYDDVSIKDGIKLYGFDDMVDSQYGHDRHGSVMRSTPSDHFGIGEVNVKFK